PPRPTLFPYTTLFRSHKEPRRTRKLLGRVADATEVYSERRLPRRFSFFLGSGHPSGGRSLRSAFLMASSQSPSILTRSGSGPRLDRKSTRLNSSHVKI